MLYKINNIVYVKTSKIINDIVIILYSSHTHTYVFSFSQFIYKNKITKITFKLFSWLPLSVTALDSHIQLQTLTTVACGLYAVHIICAIPQKTESLGKLKHLRGRAHCKILRKYCIFRVPYAFQPHRCITVRKMATPIKQVMPHWWMPCHSSLDLLSVISAVQVQSLKGGIWTAK